MGSIPAPTPSTAALVTGASSGIARRSREGSPSEATTSFWSPAVRTACASSRLSWRTAGRSVPRLSRVTWQIPSLVGRFRRGWASWDSRSTYW